MDDENETISSDASEPASASIESEPTEAPQETLDQSFDRVATQIEAREAELPPSVKAWGNDSKYWAQTPAEVQKRILEMESMRGRAGNELGQLRQSAAALNDIVSRYQLTNDDGSAVSLGPIVEESLMFARMLRADPVLAIRTLAQFTGADLAQFGPSTNDIQAMRQNYAAWQQQNAATERLREQYIDEQISAFADSHEHWDGAEDEIIDQIEIMKRNNPSRVLADPIGTLNLAYEKALKVKGVETKASREQAMKKADEARRIASINVKTKAGRSPTSISSDMWANDSWSQAYDRIQSRG